MNGDQNEVCAHEQPRRPRRPRRDAEHDDLGEAGVALREAVVGRMQHLHDEQLDVGACAVGVS